MSSDTPQHTETIAGTESKRTEWGLFGVIGFSLFGLLSVSCQTGTCGSGFEAALTVLALLCVVIGCIGFSVNTIFKK